MEGTAKWLAAVSPVPWTAAVVSGLDADGILQRVQDVKADLIVMTTHGRGPLGRFFLGSVADELIRQAAVPVLLVRPRDPAPGIVPEPLLEHVLVPLDGSSLAECVSGAGLGLRAVVGGSLYVAASHRSQPSNHRRKAEPTAPAGTGTRGGGTSVPGEDRRTAARGRHGGADAHCRRPARRPRHSGGSTDAALRFHRLGDAWTRRPTADAVGQRRRQGDPWIFYPGTRVPANCLRLCCAPTVGGGCG